MQRLWNVSTCRGLPFVVAVLFSACGARDDSANVPMAKTEVELLGRSFRVVRLFERNGAVEVLACWEAEDGTLVFIDYDGAVEPIDEAAIWLSSAPPHSREDLLGLLLLEDAAPGRPSPACDRLADVELDR